MKKEFVRADSENGIDYNNIRFDPTNPRILDLLQHNPDWGHAEIKDHFLYGKGKNNIKKLKEDIKIANQLFEPITIRKIEHTDEYIVVEGNQRLAAHHWLNDIDKDTSLPNWPKIDVIIISDFKKVELEQFLYFIHVEGKDQWKAYNKALKIVSLLEEFTPEEVHKKFDLTVKNINEMKETIDVIKKNRLNENKYSIISWLVKCRDLNDIFAAQTVDKEIFYEKFIESVKKAEEDDDFSSTVWRGHFAKIANINATQILKKFCNHGDFNRSRNEWRAHPASTGVVAALKEINQHFRDDPNLDSKLFDLLKTKTTNENKKIKDAIKYELKTLAKVLEKRAKALEKKY